MKYAAQMSSGVMIYIPSFIKIRSGIKKDGDPVSLLQESRLKTRLLAFSLGRNTIANHVTR
jgi:hypothetical protein